MSGATETHKNETTNRNLIANDIWWTWSLEGVHYGAVSPLTFTTALWYDNTENTQHRGGLLYADFTGDDRSRHDFALIGHYELTMSEIPDTGGAEYPAILTVEGRFNDAAYSDINTADPDIDIIVVGCGFASREL